MFFSQIPGHTETKKLLINSVQMQHVAHAQLFLGAEGSASLALALAYATYLNCENPQPDDSCGNCASCTKQNKLVHPDVHYVMPVVKVKDKDAIAQNFLPDWREFILESPFQSLNAWMQHIGAENKQGNIAKEESRQLVRFISLKAFEAKYKIVLLWLPELLHPTAANALLKNLEEPPQNTIFLLVSQSVERLLPTILSRTQLLNIRNYSDQEVEEYLQTELQVPAERARQVAHLAEGNIYAATQLSAEISNDYFDFFANWMRNCFARKFDQVLVQSDGFQKLGRENQKNFLHYSLSLLRKVLLYGVDPGLVGFLPPAELDFVTKFSRFVTTNNAASLTQEINQAHYHIERNANAKMVFVDSSVQISGYLQAQA